jgi:nucleoid-associated protein YgaU
MFGSGPLTPNIRSGMLWGMARTRVRRRRLAAVAILIGTWALGGSVAGAVGLVGPDASSQVRTYVVRPGDTLWSIAGRFEPDEDPREVVYELTRANEVDAGGLVPGQRLVVPAIG